MQGNIQKGNIWRRKNEKEIYNSDRVRLLFWPNAFQGRQESQIGRIYDSVGDSFYAKVMFITQSKVICKVLEEKRKKMPGNMKDKYEKIEI